MFKISLSLEEILHLIRSEILKVMRFGGEIHLALVDSFS